jgi:putative pyoverdin transport system ATP-binding/permease protein
VNYNEVSITINLICAIVTLVTLYYIRVLIREIIKKERIFKGNGISGVIAFFMSLIMMAGFAYCLYNAPKLLGDSISWVLIEQAGPTSLIHAVISLSVVIPVFFVYFTLSYFFIKKDDRPYFLIIILSAVTGIGNSIIIFIINNVLARSMNPDSRKIGIESGLYLYFIFGMLLFITSSYIVKRKMIAITNTIIYDTRMKIIDKILHASFYNFEALGKEKVFATLNKDTEIISNSINLIVNFAAGIISLITCFIYLGTLNMLAMILSLAVICIAVALFMLVSQSARKLFEKNRDYQNIFFKNLDDLVGGFKELYINNKKLAGFFEEIKKNCRIYSNTRTEGENKFVGVTIMGGIMYLFIVGIVVFIFPFLFSNLQSETLRNYVLVYL